MKRRGFSLIEIVIAIFVTSAVLAGAVPLIFNTISANKAAKIKTSAYEAANKEIEKLKNQNIATFTTHSFTPSGVPSGTGTLTVIKNDPELADISSKVTWSFRGKQQNIEIRTYIYGAVE